MKIYAISDIHGCLEALVKRLSHLKHEGFFEENCQDELVFLGDYIDRGPESLAVVKVVMELEQRSPGRVIALMGNHEDDFLRWLGDEDADWNDEVLIDDEVEDLLATLVADFGPAASHAPIDRLKMWRLSDTYGNTMRSFLGHEAFVELDRAIEFDDAYAADAFEHACEHIRTEHANIVRWIRGLREYYETDRQIFVHAGIDESCGEEWRVATSRNTILWDRNTPKGSFYKDIIAGHTATSSISGDPSFHGVFWDNESHFYIDGMTIISGRLPVLVFDSDKNDYWELDEMGAPKALASIS